MLISLLLLATAVAPAPDPSAADANLRPPSQKPPSAVLIPTARPCVAGTQLADVPKAEDLVRPQAVATDPVVPPVVRRQDLGSGRTLVLFDGVRVPGGASPPVEGAPAPRTINLRSGPSVGGTARPLWYPGENKEEGLYAPVFKIVDGCEVSTPISSHLAPQIIGNSAAQQIVPEGGR